MRLLYIFLVALCSQLYAPLSHAQSDTAQPVETSKTFGDYVVFYNAFPSTVLLPAVAADYKIERGNDIAFINIALRKRAHNQDVAPPTKVTGTYSDLMQNQPLEFREIREQNAIYYIAQVHYDNHALLRFDIQLQPQLEAGEVAPLDSPFKISFTRKFYTEK